MLSVALAGMAVNLPIPVPNINCLDNYFTTVSDLCKEAVGRETETAQLLKDLEVIYKDVVVRAVRPMRNWTKIGFPRSNTWWVSPTRLLPRNH